MEIKKILQFPIPESNTEDDYDFLEVNLDLTERSDLNQYLSFIEENWQIDSVQDNNSKNVVTMRRYRHYPAPYNYHWASPLSEDDKIYYYNPSEGVRIVIRYAPTVGNWVSVEKLLTGRWAAMSHDNYNQITLLKQAILQNSD